MGLLIGIGATKPAFPYDHYYGIEWDDAVAVSSATRIGRPELHAELPIQSRMKRCLLNDQGQVTAYLDPADSTQLEGGGAAILDGSQGQVMVELPEHYRRFEKEGTKNRCLISLKALPGFHHVPKAYRSAYQATVERSVASYQRRQPTLTTGEGTITALGWNIPIAARQTSLQHIPHQLPDIRPEQGCRRPGRSRLELRPVRTPKNDFLAVRHRVRELQCSITI